MGFRRGNDNANFLEGDDRWWEGYADQLFGRGGDDTLRGGRGADLLHGGEGQDTVDYSTSPGRVYVDLARGQGFWNDAEGRSCGPASWSFPVAPTRAPSSLMSA